MTIEKAQKILDSARQKRRLIGRELDLMLGRLSPGPKKRAVTEAWPILTKQR
jgi:hypothetical protein